MFAGLFRSPKRSFSSLTEQEILAVAIAAEEDDSRIYLAYADTLRQDYPASATVFEEMAEVEDTHRKTLIDMHRKSEMAIKQFGGEGSKKLFLQLRPNENPNYPKGVEDNTHFSPLGALTMANLAVAGIRELKLDLAHRLKGIDAPAATK